MTATMTPSACRSCHAPILWATTAAGRPIPLDPDPTDDGNVELVDGVARVLGRDQVEHSTETRYQTHYRTCPQADEWRRKASRRA